MPEYHFWHYSRVDSSAEIAIDNKTTEELWSQNPTFSRVLCDGVKIRFHGREIGVIEASVRGALPSDNCQPSAALILLLRRHPL